MEGTGYTFYSIFLKFITKLRSLWLQFNFHNCWSLEYRYFSLSDYVFCPRQYRYLIDQWFLASLPPPRKCLPQILSAPEGLYSDCRSLVVCTKRCSICSICIYDCDQSLGFGQISVSLIIVPVFILQPSETDWLAY